MADHCRYLAVREFIENTDRVVHLACVIGRLAGRWCDFFAGYFAGGGKAGATVAGISCVESRKIANVIFGCGDS